MVHPQEIAFYHPSCWNMLRSPQGGSFMLHRSISWQGERWPGHGYCLVMKCVWEGQFTILCEWLQFDYNLKWDWNMCCFSRLLVKTMVMLFSSLSTLKLCNKMQGANCTLVCMCVCKYVCMGRWCDAMESNVSINVCTVCMCVYVGMPVGRRPGCDVWLWCAPSAQWDELFALLWSHQSGWGTGGILEGLWNQVISSCSSWRNIYIFCYWPLLFVVATYHWKYANLYMAYVYLCMHGVLSNGLCIWDGVVISHKWSVLFEVIETDAQMYYLLFIALHNKGCIWWHVGVVQQLNMESLH